MSLLWPPTTVDETWTMLHAILTVALTGYVVTLGWRVRRLERETRRGRPAKVRKTE